MRGQSVERQMRALRLASFATGAALVCIMSGCSPRSEIAKPDEEINFLHVVTDAQSQANQTDNGVRLDQIRSTRDEQVCALLKNLNVANWVGTVGTIDSTMAGDGIVSLLVADDVALSTWNNIFSDLQDHTIIKKGTKLFGVLGELSKGEKVVFSGKFVESDGCPEESSMTTDGSLTSPSYVFNFSSIRPLDASSD